jgi:hypothetical protein
MSPSAMQTAGFFAECAAQFAIGETESAAPAGAER